MHSSYNYKHVTASVTSVLQCLFSYTEKVINKHKNQILATHRIIVVYVLVINVKIPEYE